MTAIRSGLGTIGAHVPALTGINAGESALRMTVLTPNSQQAFLESIAVVIIQTRFVWVI